MRDQLAQFLGPREQALGERFALLSPDQVQQIVLPLLRCRSLREAQLLGAELAALRCPHGLSGDLRQQVAGGVAQV
jgi:hypothetical protein